MTTTKPIPVWRGHISDEGRFGLLDAQKPARQAYFRTLAGLDVDITVAPHKDTRSQRANAYYWSCVLARMSEEGSDGDQSPEEIHDAMCQLFLPNEPKRVEFFNRLTRERLAVDTDTRRSSKLKGDEFYEFVEKVRKFALEFMHVETENPDPQYWRRRASKAA